MDSMTASSDVLKNLSTAALDALGTPTAIIDTTGHILFSNQAWQSFNDQGASDGVQLATADNFLHALDLASAIGNSSLHMGVESLRRTLEKGKAQLSFDYPVMSNNERLWFRIVAHAMQGLGTSHYVISHYDITTLVQSKLSLAECNNTHAATGAPRAEHMQKFLVDEIARCRRQQTALSFALLKVANHKVIRDTFGVMAADDCLANVYQETLQLLRRPSDLVGHFDDDIFAIVMGNTNGKSAQHIIQAMVKSIASLRIEGLPDEPAQNVAVLSRIVAVVPQETHTADWFHQQVTSMLNQVGQDLVLYEPNG